MLSTPWRIPDGRSIVAGDNGAAAPTLGPKLRAELRNADSVDVEQLWEQYYFSEFGKYPG